MRDFPARAWFYTLFVAVVAAATDLSLLRHQDGIHARAAVLFGLLFLVTELAPFQLPHASYSVSFVIAVAALTAVGPLEAAVAASFGALDLSVRERPDWVGRMVFNASQLALSTALAGKAYLATGGRIGHIDASAFPGILVPLAAASATYFVVNTGLVAGMVALVRHVKFLDIWSLNYMSIVASTLAFAVMGVLLASLYQGMGVVAVLFVLVPLVVARRALEAAVVMDEAYEATLRSLVTAIEAKDAYTRGHAERVSKLAAMTARELGISERRVRELRIAAVMHDVGKLVVSTAILTKPGKLTDDEFDHMKTHPVRGVEIVGEIDFLRDGEAIFAVRHHHERMDGRGYPDGLVGEGIPLTARIVMVSDAFDAMTSTRTYRNAMPVAKALAELRRCEGVQFDGRCVDALERALARHGWEPFPEAFEDRVPVPAEVALV